MSLRTLPINLESLIELSARLNQTDDVKFILNAALLSLMGKLIVSNGCALISYDNHCQFKVLVSKGRHDFDNVRLSNLNEIREINSIESTESFLRNKGLKYFIPVKYRDNVLAVFCLGKQLMNEDMDDNDKHYMRLVASITANALTIAQERIHLKQVQNKLELQNLILTSLFEISNDFSALLSREQILKVLSLRLMGMLMINKFAVYRVENSYLEPIINKCDHEIDKNFHIHLSNINSIITRKNNKIEELDQLFSITNLEVISPMVVQDKIRGILLIGKRMNDEDFSQENLSFIESIANTTILALENERLFKQELEKKKLESELTMALQIQKGLLPSSFPHVENYAFYGESIPSRHVGGDYFDFIEINNNNTLIVIADVSGKGMAASLLMANVQAALKLLASLDLELSDIINRMNRLLFENTAPDIFVTMFIGIINFQENKIKYINAGHNHPFVINNGTLIEKLSTGGMPLGIFLDKYEYESHSYQIKDNDIIVFYTDGITEAQNISQQEFGENTFINLLLNQTDTHPKRLVETAFVELKKFTEGCPQYDDITISIVKYK